MKKKYIHFDPKDGWPNKPGYFYECEICKESIPSAPAEYQKCKCGNFSIDVDYGRRGAKQPDKVKLYKLI